MSRIIVIAPPRCSQDKVRIPDAFHIAELGFAEYIQYLHKKRVDVELVDLNYAVNGIYNIVSDKNPGPSIDLTYFVQPKNYYSILQFLSNACNDLATVQFINLKVKQMLQGVGLSKGDAFCILLGWPNRVLAGLAIAKYLKEKKGKPVFLSNPMRSIFFGEPFNIKKLAAFNFVDVVIERPGKNMIQLHSCVKKNDFTGSSLSRIPEIYFKEEGQICSTDVKDNEIDLNEMPVPILKHLQNRKVKFMTYELSLGCPHQCFYCIFVRQKFVYKQPKKVVRDLIYLRNKYRCRYFYFNTSAVNITKEYLEELLKAFAKEKTDIRWLSFAYPKYLDYKTLKRMHEAGCRLIDTGVEQGSQKNLDSLKREPRIKEVGDVLANCRKVGITTNLSFIVGMPGMKNEEEHICKFLETYRDRIDYFTVHKFDIHYVNIDSCQRKWKDIKIYDVPIDARVYPFTDKQHDSYSERVRLCDEKERQIRSRAQALGIKFRQNAYDGLNFPLQIEDFYLKALMK